MISESFLGGRNKIWFWVFACLSFLAYLLYWAFPPIGARSGSSSIGYLLGALTALGVLYLLYFAVRKRSYGSSGMPLKDWLAVHVWFGTSLIFIGALHSGFSVGMNLHGVTYLAMLATILSGVIGAFVYVSLAPRIPSHRGTTAGGPALERIAEIDQEITPLTAESSPELRGLLKQFLPALTLRAIGRFSFEPRDLSEKLLKFSEQEFRGNERLIKLVSERASLVAKLSEELRVKRALKGWLYWHVPLALATLVLMIMHIVAVFYWR